jgi:hypothetical protein
VAHASKNENTCCVAYLACVGSGVEGVGVGGEGASSMRVVAS